MKPASLPENELERLQALADYHILDTEPEPKFDELTELASSICGTPIALVSLIDESRQWFKSHHGLDATETPREVAFCSHAILQDDIFEIEDSRKDERFFDNPLVADEPKVIFYAGAPLITPDGQALGTLCVIDNEPKKLSPEKKRQLRIIANQVVTQLELRKNNRLKNELFDDLMKVIEQMNQRNDDLYQFSNRLSHDMSGSLRQINAFSELSIDDLKSGNIEKALQKYHYIVDGCTKLQTLIKDVFALSKADLTCEVVDGIDLEGILKEAINDANSTIGNHNVNIEYSLNINNTFCSQAIRIKQVLYNLITNSIKYSCSEREKSYVKIDIKENQHSICITIKDNGLGIPEKYQSKLFQPFERLHPKVAEGSGLGTVIIKKHVDALQGKITFQSSPEGTEFTIDLPSLKETTVTS